MCVAFAAALIALWLIVDPRTPDLAAQVYRVGLFRQLGFAVWDAHWYAGHDLPGYSLLFPPLGLAARAARRWRALSVLASTLLFERLVGSASTARAARWGAAWFAVAAVGDVWIGRLTFALGVSFALAAVLALHARASGCGRRVLAALCAAASPVAGVLLALAALTRRARAALAARAARRWRCRRRSVVLALALLFPEGGYEPYPDRCRSRRRSRSSAAFLVGAAAARSGCCASGALVYLLACVLCLLVHTPMGSNVERYGVLLAGPLLLCALLAATGAASTACRGGARIGPVGRAAALCVIARCGSVWGPVRETLAVAGSESTSASYYVPVERFLARSTRGGPVRVEVPLTRSHWEAALLAPTRVARARLGEAARRRATTTCCSRRADRGGLRALAARAGGLLRGAAGRAA